MIKNKEENLLNTNQNNGADSVLPSDPQTSIKAGLVVLLLGFVGFLLWAGFAGLDEGVPSTGTVVVDTKRKVIQHQTGGIIETILARDGDKVKAGQVLLKIISTQSKTNLLINQNEAALYKRQVEQLKPLVLEGYFPENQYLDIKRKYEDAVAKVALSKEDLERTEIRSPVEGVVMSLSNNTIGGVIPPGGKVMEVIPNGEQLIIEAQIPPHLVDRIHAGLDADVRFTSLNQKTTPVILGKVEWVSADRVQDPNKPDNVYFTARVQLESDALNKLNGQVLIPGMPADVVIKTGSRTFFNYLMKPITDRAALSFKER